MEIIECCPICKSNLFQSFLTCEDFTSSHEKFELKKCSSCTFIITSPRPDSNQLSHYYKSEQYISHTNKSAGLLDNIYLLARNFTLRWKVNLLNNYRKTNASAILDYGCGTGQFLSICKDNGWKIAGYEPSEKPRMMASQITGTNIADDHHTLAREKYDAITLWHVLEHVSELNSTIELLASLLKPNGVLLIAVPNHQAHDALYYKNYWAAFDVPRHLWHFNTASMKALLKSHQLTLQKVKPMSLDAYYVSLLSEKYVAANSLSVSAVIKGIYRGLISNLRARVSKNYSSLIYIITK